jgi:hypothetical protein
MTDCWGYAGASVTGTSHLKNQDGACQDTHRCTFSHDLQVLVCVVSDGAGSAPCSGEGSKRTCDFVVERVLASSQAEIYSRDFALDTVDRVREMLVGIAQSEGRPSRDYACTLLVAVVGDEKVSFWQIGDGAICFRKRSEEGLHFAFWPAKGEYANVTEFVTDPTAAEELQFDAGDMPIVDLAMFSDGLERLALDFNAGEVHAQFFASLFPYLYRCSPGHLLELESQMSAFLGSERVNARTDDDKTLILATRQHDAN